MLSNENRNANDQISAAEAMRRARALAQNLMNAEHNDEPDPYAGRNLESPAHGVHVRRVIPIDLRVSVTQEVKDHNSRVANLGVKP
jgi:hypothetical protein